MRCYLLGWVSSEPLRAAVNNNTLSFEFLATSVAIFLRQKREAPLVKEPPGASSDAFNEAIRCLSIQLVYVSGQYTKDAELSSEHWRFFNIAKPRDGVGPAASESTPINAEPPFVLHVM